MKIAHYTRLLRLFWSTAVAAEMEYRLNFVLSALTSLGGLVGNVFGLSLFFQRQTHLGGWRWEEALLVMGLFTLLDGLSSILLSPNLSRIVAHVRNGTLDFVLLKPVDSQFWLSTRNISPWGVPNLLFGLGLMLYAGMKLQLSPWNCLWALVPVGLSVLILYSIWFSLGTMTIWFVKIYNVTEVLRSLLEAGRYPVTAYPAAYRVVFTFVLPVAFLTTIPAQSMLGQSPAKWILAELALALGLFLFSRWFWRFAMRSYTSASS